MTARRLRTRVAMSPAARSSVPENEEHSGRIAFLLGDIMNSAAEADWTQAEDGEIADAVLVLVDDPEDETRAVDIPASPTQPSFIIRLGRTTSEHMAIYPMSDVGAHAVGSLANPPDITIGFEGMRLAAVQWLRNLPETAAASPEAELSSSVETLVARIADLSEDRDRLQSLLMRSERERGRLEAEVERLSELLKAKALEGTAVLRGDPVSKQEARSLASGVQSLVTHVVAGIIGNRADAAFVDVVRLAAPELLDITKAVIEVLRRSSHSW